MSDTIKELIFNTDDAERLEALAKLVITRLNEVRALPNEKYFLGVIHDMGRMPRNHD